VTVERTVQHQNTDSTSCSNARNKRVPTTNLAVMTVEYPVLTAKFTAPSTKRIVLTAHLHRPTESKAYSSNIKAKILTVKQKYGQEGLLEYSELYKIISELAKKKIISVVFW
jgi:hypothetical protein